MPKKIRTYKKLPNNFNEDRIKLRKLDNKTSLVFNEKNNQALYQLKDPLIRVLRKEKKYLISLRKAYNLTFKLDQVLTGDPHNGDHGYMVRSLYFDTVNDRDYYEKEDGLFSRKKIRLRLYSPSDQWVKLEKKEKEGDNQCKRSLNISKEVAKQMMNGLYEGLLTYDSPFAQEVYLDLNLGAYVPKCIVEYRRKAYIVPENDIRVTIDSDIRASESNFDLFSDNLNLYSVTHPNDVTLEVKFNQFILSYVKSLLDSCRKTQITNSKYCLARSLSHGQLNTL